MVMQLPAVEIVLFPLGRSLRHINTDGDRATYTPERVHTGSTYLVLWKVFLRHGSFDATAPWFREMIMCACVGGHDMYEYNILGFFFSVSFVPCIYSNRLFPCSSSARTGRSGRFFC